MRQRVLWSTALLGILPAVTGAHDIWLHVEKLSLEVGETVVVRQLVGEELTTAADSKGTTELGVLRDMTPRFELISDRRAIDLLEELPSFRERPEVKPVLERAVEEPGLMLVAMDHAVLYTDHSDEEFLDYLEHEGLDPARYRPHMASDGYQDEGYVRALKALVRVGASDSTSELWARKIGQPLEIVLQQNPYLLETGDTLTAQILLDGLPLPDVRVGALRSRESGGLTRQSARTDAEGIAAFTVDGSGRWLLRLVHLSPCADESKIVDCEEADWQSYWASFSFETN